MIIIFYRDIARHNWVLACCWLLLDGDRILLARCNSVRLRLSNDNLLRLLRYERAVILNYYPHTFCTFLLKM